MIQDKNVIHLSDALSDTVQHAKHNIYVQQVNHRFLPPPQKVIICSLELAA